MTPDTATVAPYVTVEDAAVALDCSSRTVRRKFAEYLKRRSVGGRSRAVIPLSALVAFGQEIEDPRWESYREELADLKQAHLQLLGAVKRVTVRLDRLESRA